MARIRISTNDDNNDTWYNNSALDSVHLDPKGLETCIDLMYALCATIYLNLKVERSAFASQLVREKIFRKNRGIKEQGNVQHSQRA